jgi:GTP-binding protein EngB required for normal cell division
LSVEEKAVVEDWKERLKEAKGKTFTFLLIGRTGMGKSSTLNSLMGAEIAPVSDFDPCTADINIQETDLHGAVVRVIDTPGLCDMEGAANDAKYIELMRHKIPYTIDVVLFVSRLNEPRVDASEQRGLRLITEAFGEVFWKKAVIVFTCSDKVPPSRFEEYLDERTKRIHAALLKLQLNHDTIHAIPSVAVDNTDLEKVNPDGKTWIQQLYLTVFSRADDSSKYVFALSTSHMLEKIGVTPLTLWDKVTVGLMAGNSGIIAIQALNLVGGASLLSNPIGWIIILGSAAVGGKKMYDVSKKK